MRVQKIDWSLHITICLIFRKREISITGNPKSATKNRILMKFTCMLSQTILDVCAENWHRILSTILSLHITIRLIFRKLEINFNN